MRWVRGLLILLFVLFSVTLTLMTVQVLDDQEVDNLAVGMRMPASVRTFDPASVAGLPAPAHRWLRHAIAPGTPLASTAELRMRGRWRPPGAEHWLPFEAIEILSPRRGFLWRANAWDGSFGLRWVEHYVDGAARERRALWGLIPLGTDESAELHTSYRQRLALESVWVPASLLPGHYVAWEPIDEQRARYRVLIEGERYPVVIRVGPDGALRAVATERLQRHRDGSWSPAPFGLAVEAEQTIEGYTIPSRLRGGWSYGKPETEPTIAIELTHAHFLPPKSPRGTGSPDSARPAAPTSSAHTKPQTGDAQ